MLGGLDDDKRKYYSTIDKAQQVDDDTPPKQDTPPDKGAPPPVDVPNIDGLRAAIDQGGYVSARHGTSPAVAMQAQAALKSLGYDLGEFGDNGDGIDGKIGPVTTAAIRQFQQDNGLQPDGVMGANTLAAMTTQLAALENSGQDKAPQAQPQPNQEPKTMVSLAAEAPHNQMAAVLAQAGGLEGVPAFRDMATHTDPDQVAMSGEEAARDKAVVTAAATQERSAGVVMGA